MAQEHNDEVLECAVTEDRLARRARGEDISSEEYTPTPTELERSAEFASKIRPPFKAIRISRESGAIVGVMRYARTPIVHRPARRQSAPRHRHAARRARSRSPSRRSDDDPEPKALAPRQLCLRPGCDVKFAAKGKRRYHDDACADLARQQRRRAKIRAAGPAIAEPIVCPDCGEFVSRLVEVTGWCDSCTRIHVSQTFPVREATRLVRGTRRFEVSLIPLELGFDARPMNGRLHWPNSRPMREVLIETVDLAFPQLARLMEGADTDDRYWDRMAA
jgi:hypothetical protein